MTLSLDVFWSFRSPWLYLATPRLVAWQEEYDLDVVFRPWGLKPDNSVIHQFG